MHRSGYSTQNIYNQIGRHLGEWRLKNLFTTHNRGRPCLVEHDLQWDWRIALGWSTWNKSRERAGARGKNLFYGQRSTSSGAGQIYCRSTENCVVCSCVSWTLCTVGIGQYGCWGNEQNTLLVLPLQTAQPCFAQHPNMRLEI